MSRVFADMDASLCESSRRKAQSRIQKQDPRTLITTVGDVTFPHTLFFDKTQKKCRYLLYELLGFPNREQFSTLAEVKTLYEAEAPSYQHAADSLSGKRVYLCSNGGNWIKAGKDYVDKSVLVADRYHLMKNINRVARLTLDEEKETKKRFYKYLYKDQLLAAKKLLTRIKNRGFYRSPTREAESHPQRSPGFLFRNSFSFLN